MATGGSRFTRRYTDQQKDALLKAVCIDRLTVAAAVRAAAAGTLGLDPFEMNRLYAYDLVKKGRDAYEAGNPEALALAVEREMHGAELDALANIRAIRKALANGETSDTSSLAVATRNLATINKARRDSAPKKQAEQQNASKNNTSEAVNSSDSTLSSLLDLANTGANTGKTANTADHGFKTQVEGARTGSVSRTRS